MSNKYRIWANATTKQLKFRHLSERQVAKVPLTVKARIYREIMVPAWADYYERVEEAYEERFGK